MLMNMFDILPDDILWKALTLSPSKSIKDYVVWLNHYLRPFGLTSISNNTRLKTYIESEAFKTALHPSILNLGEPGNNFLNWNKRIKQHIGIASDWLYKPLEITDKKEIPQGSSCFQIASMNPITQQWELMGVNIQRDSIYHIFEDEKEICYNLKTKLDDYGDTWRRPLFNIASSQKYVAIVNGSFSVVVYDCKNGKQYSLDLQEIVCQLEIINLKLYIITLSQDEKSQSLWVYELEKIDSEILDSKIPLPVGVNRFYMYKDYLVLLTSNADNLQSLPLANLKTTGIEKEWISLPLERNGRGMGICLSEMGIFTVLAEGDKLKICCIQIDNRGFSRQEKSITLGEEFHNVAIFDVVYHLDRLIIRTGGFKILVVDYFSESIIQTFKDLAGPTIVRHQDSFIHQMVASASKIYLFLLYKMNLPDGSRKFFTHIHTLQPKKDDEKRG
jgi:hypothetical protein